MTRKVWALAGIVLFCGSAWVSAQKSGGKLTSDDLVEIQQLYARYNWTLDAGDAEGYASTFTPDGVFNNNVGHDAIVKFADTFHAGLGAHVRHWNTNLLILPSLNSMFDAAQIRVGSNERHPPQIIFIMLFGLGLGGSLLAGFGMAAGKARSWVHMVTFAAALAFALFVVTDLEFPRLGLVRIDSFDHHLADLLERM